jgi:3-hydroxyacyl-[acyl-carrier-protein] dehydratase
MQLNKSQVMSFLPHREPFLFIDSLKDIILPSSLRDLAGPFTHQQLIGGKSICSFKVDESLAVLQGHFPGEPILPGVIQIEMMAQAASFLAIYSLNQSIEKSKLDVQLVAVDGAKFRKPVIPPMELEIQAELKKVRGHILVYDCEIRSENEIISQTSIMASLKISYH